MQKKLIALAIAAAFSAPAFAENANVTFYGKAFMTLDQMSSSNPAVVSQTRVNTNASRFGLKGSEDLGGGLTAVYQFEVQMDADGSGGNGLGNGTRNSGAGVGGEFGQVMFGNWDTPFKVVHNKIELFDNTTSWSSTNVIGRSAGKNYNSRLKNMVQYTSPKIADAVTVAVLYAPDEAKTATTNKTDLAMSAAYDLDGIYVAAAYESRPDQTTTGKSDSAMRVVGAFEIDAFTVGAMYESLKTNTSATVNVTGKNMEVVGKFKSGPSVIAVNYAKAGSTSVAPVVANDVTQATLKYSYNFSKRTELFAAYTSSKANAATAVTTKYLGAGLVHSF
ncbi:MAG: porin [Nitrosomonadales bacterium]|nr:porin [Nitrosomonadales bacterium]